jgi:hypothetical protein
LQRSAAHAGAIGGGRAISLASLRRFCAIASNVNSNWAPHGPRNRSRPSRRIRFKCANSVSTRFLEYSQSHRLEEATVGLALLCSLAGFFKVVLFPREPLAKFGCQKSESGFWLHPTALIAGR